MTIMTFKNDSENRRAALVGRLISGNIIDTKEGILLLENPKSSSTVLLRSGNEPKDKKDRHDRLVGKILSRGKINSFEAVILLGFELESRLKKEKLKKEDTSYGLLYDTPHHSPLPIIPTPQPNLSEKKKKDCKCTECECDKKR